MNKKILKKFGFFKDQEGIINRYLREKEGWERHLKNTRGFILKIAESKVKGKVVVLGSGWLLDVPWEDLCLQFKELVLIDIKHPRQIIHKIKNNTNVKLIETDISGLAEPVFIGLKQGKYFDLNSIRPEYDDEFIKEINEADFVVSVNLLNQLDILICDYLKDKTTFDDLSINNFRKTIQENHIKLLPKKKSALITDYEELNLNDNKQISDRKKLIYLPGFDAIDGERWTWNFDLQKTYRKNVQTIFKVMAIDL